MLAVYFYIAIFYKGITMKKLFFTAFVLSVIAILSTTSFSQLRGLGFVAPQIKDLTSIAYPEIGEIVFNTTDSKLYVNTTGEETTSAWKDLTATGAGSTAVQYVNYSHTGASGSYGSTNTNTVYLDTLTESFGSGLASITSTPTGGLVITALQDDIEVNYNFSNGNTSGAEYMCIVKNGIKTTDCSAQTPSKIKSIAYANNDTNKANLSAVVHLDTSDDVVVLGTNLRGCGSVCWNWHATISIKKVIAAGE